jgi:hypothetical protein
MSQRVRSSDNYLFLETKVLGMELPERMIPPMVLSV